uniref:STAS domain-containing protein n=1 Tax=Aeribacillus sp. FSL W8-0870 TaxID=2954706 RepID=UPI00403F48BA
MSLKISEIVEFIRMHRDEIMKDWIDRFNKADAQSISAESDQIDQAIAAEYVNILIEWSKNKEDEFSGKIHEFSKRIVQLDWPMDKIAQCLHTFEKILFAKLLEKQIPSDPLELLSEIEKVTSPVNREVFLQYTSSYERTINLQKMALQELSAPLIPVFDSITVMPLIGTIDTDRAKRIMENLLKGVVKYRSEVVLIDITGVPVVDTMVAHHIIQAAEAVRLVGAKSLLVGIRPEIAQTIVNLGIDLSQITTKNTLQKGIEAALEMTNRKIVSMGERR